MTFDITRQLNLNDTEGVVGQGRTSSDVLHLWMFIMLEPQLGPCKKNNSVRGRHYISVQCKLLQLHQVSSAEMEGKFNGRKVEQ